MNIMIYVGQAPSRADVLAFSTPLVRSVATHVTLVVGKNAGGQPLLDDAAAQLQVPDQVQVELCALPGGAQNAILAAAHAHAYDLVIFGRLRPRIRRMLFGRRSRRIAAKLEPSVLRVQGSVRPIKRALIASGGNNNTLHNAHAAAQLLAPLKAEATVLHVDSQQPITFQPPRQRDRDRAFIESDTPEAGHVRDAVAYLEDKQVTVKPKIRYGPVIDEILDELRTGKYDLLIIGAHRVASALDRILLEDISGDLMHVSPVPVLVVKSKK
jgi:nucleotide-binding universal stress UspA family protein